MQKHEGWLEALFQRIINGANQKRSVRLCELALPGTHHSLITEVRGWGKMISSLAVCQEVSIKEQFAAGVRFFHLAIGDDTEPGVIYAKHYFPAKPIHRQLLDLLECLHTHPKEFVVLYIKKDFDSKLSQQGVDSLSEMVLQVFSSVGFIANSHSEDDVTGWYRRGKLPGQVILAGMKHLSHGLQGKLVWRCDNSYHQTQSDNPQQLVTRVLEFTERQPWPPTVLMNYECIITLGMCKVLSFSTIKKQSVALQKIFQELLEDSKFVERSNIVMVDFITAEQGASIIRLNHHRFLQ